MKDINNKNFVVLFKTIKEGENISYVPVDIISGTYDENSHIFYDKNNTPYKHLIEMPGSYGFAFRTDVEEKIKKYQNLPFAFVKSLLLNAFKKYNYLLTTIEDTNTPAILITNKKTNEQELLLEDDTLMYYKNSHPAFIELLSKVNNEDNEIEEIKIDIKSLYEKITDNIIDQDDQIKMLLSAIWKQYNDFSEGKARNILIDGNTSVGKTEIINNIIKQTNIPIVMASISEFIPNGGPARSLSELLFSLIDRAGGNLNNAQRGIIVLDDIDKITDSDIYSTSVRKSLQEELIKLTNSGKIDMIYNYTEFTFDTSKLMVIIIGNFNRNDKLNDKIVGFESNHSKYLNQSEKEYYVAKGLLPEFIGEFPVIVKMNDLGYDSFLKILKKSKNGSLNLNKDFLKKQGIDLCLNEDVIKKIASIASNSKFGARSIDETVEKMLSIASFEIANNPDVYSKLIVSEETIDDNKKYRLIRKFGK